MDDPQHRHCIESYTPSTDVAEFDTIWGEIDHHILPGIAQSRGAAG